MNIELYPSSHWQISLVLLYRYFIRLKKYIAKEFPFSENESDHILRLLKTLAFDRSFYVNATDYSLHVLYERKQISDSQLNFFKDSQEKTRSVLADLKELRTNNYSRNIFLSILESSYLLVEAIILQRSVGPGYHSVIPEANRKRDEGTELCSSVYSAILEIDNESLIKKTRYDYENINDYSTSLLNEEFVTEEYFALHPTFQFTDEKDIILNLIRKDVDIVKRIDSRSFEELTADILHSMGYEVDVTAQSDDGGYDVLALSKDSKKILIECKRYNNNVGVEIVRCLHGVLADTKADKGIIVTTADSFTKRAREHLERNGEILEGVAFKELLSWLKEYDEFNL